MNILSQPKGGFVVEKKLEQDLADKVKQLQKIQKGLQKIKPSVEISMITEDPIVEDQDPIEEDP